MSRQRSDSPIEYPTGIIVCGRHRQAVCGICHVNYSFHNAKIVETNRQKKIEDLESDSDDEGEGEDEDPYWAKRFAPPTPFDAPKHLFAEGYTPLMPDRTRYVRIDNPQELLIYIDGACVEKGQEAPRGGCAVVFRPEYPYETSSLSFRLETLNPTGATEPDYINNRREKAHIGDRARLRAAVAAFQHQAWYIEGFKRIVIATDSTYLATGITEWSKGWIRRAWNTHQGKKIQNHDIWRLLLLEVQKFHRNALNWYREQGEACEVEDIEVLFWHLPCELNQRADKLAKEAAKKGIDPAFSASNAGCVHGVVHA